MTLTDVQLTLAALAALPTDGAQAGIEALVGLADRHGLRRVDELITAWSDRHRGPRESAVT